MPMLTEPRHLSAYRLQNERNVLYNQVKDSQSQRLIPP